MYREEQRKKIKMEIIAELGGLSCEKYPKLVRLISWNGYAPKFDIRTWYNEGKLPSKGLTLTEDEARELLDILSEHFR